LDDSLWEGLRAQPSPNVAIIWPNAKEMSQCAPDEFWIAKQVLARIADLLADKQATVNNPRHLVIFVEL